MNLRPTTPPAPAPPATQRHQPRLDVNVLFTNPGDTMRALRQAATLAANLHARIRVVVPQVVGYPLPLDEPAVSPAFSKQLFASLADGIDVETRFELFLCRDVRELCRGVFPPQSIVMVAGRRSGWFSRTGRLCRTLERSGIHVVPVGVH